MENKVGFTITNRDRAFKAWQSSTELVRDYQAYSNEIKDEKELSALFKEYAEDEALHAARLLEVLKGYEQ